MTASTINLERRGSGRPLLLVHGLGASWPSWSPILDDLARRREVIAIDLPGFGDSPPLLGEVVERCVAAGLVESTEIGLA